MDHASTAFDIAERVYATCRRLGIPPTPENYLLWYTHCSGDHPALSRMIRLLEENGDPLGPERCRELYERFFLRSDMERTVARCGARLEQLMREVEEQLEGAGRRNEEACDRIAALGGRIARDGDPGEICRLAGRLLGEAKRVAAELRMLSGQMHAKAAEVATLRSSLEQARREAEQDPLTGLANRKAYERRLRELARESMETGRLLSLVVVDIDHFKSFNDMYGHKVGDAVLRVVAEVLRRHVRQDDLVARYGGEEFVLLLADAGLDAALAVAERIREEVGARHLRDRRTGRDLGRLTISAGVAEYRPGEPLEELFRRADAALYEAKRTGRNRVVAETEVSAPDAAPLP